MFSRLLWHLGCPHRKSRCRPSSPLHRQCDARASFSFVRTCLYACALLLPALAAAPASAQLVLQLDLSPDRVNAGDSVSAVLCRTQPSGSCPAVETYGIDATFRLRGESDRGGEVFSEEITITAAEITPTKAVSLGPLPAGIWSFSLADVDEMPPGDGITLSAPPQLVSFASVGRVQLEAVPPEVAVGEAVRLRLVPDGVYGLAREFVVQGSSHLGAEADPLTVQVSADEGVVEVLFTSLPVGRWSFFLTENLVGASTRTISLLRGTQVRVGFPAITVGRPEAPGVFSSDGISYASLSDLVVLRVSTSAPPRQQVTFMLRGESGSGEFTDVQPVTLATDGSPSIVNFSVPGEGLWTVYVAQQDPANTADSAVPSAFALVRVGPPPLRLSGYDSWGSEEDVQLRLSSPLAITGDFAVKGVNGSSSLTRMVSFASTAQQEINFGRLDGGQWSFRVIDSSPTGAADLSRAEREVLIEDSMRFTIRFQPEHANTVRYDSTRSRYFALTGTRVTALFRTPNGLPGEACRRNVFAQIQGLTGSGNLIVSRQAQIGFVGDGICPGQINEHNFDVTFATPNFVDRYLFRLAGVGISGDIRIVYVEARPAVESFSPGQDVIATGEPAVLNLRLREPAVVDGRFTVLAQDISAAGSSPRFNTIQLLRGESSASVSFRNMEQGVWIFTLVQASPPQLQTPQLLATAPAQVMTAPIVRLEAPAIVPDAEVVLRLVTDFTLPVPATFTITATGMPAGGGAAFALMTQTIHLPAGESTADVTFSGLSVGSWIFSITGVEPENVRLDLRSTAAVTVGSLRAVLRAADLDGRVQAGRDVVILLELPQPLGRDIVLSVVGEGPGDMSRVLPITLRSGASTASAVFSGLEPGSWQFTVNASVEGIDTEGVMVTLEVVSRSALSLSVQGAANLADTGNVLPSALAVQLRITAAPAAIDDATLTLRAVSGAASQMITVTLPADTTAVTADFGVLPDGVWRFSVTDAAPDDLFEAAAAVEVEIRRPRGTLTVRTIVSGGIDLPLTVAFDFPAGFAASDNFANRLIAISPAGDQTSRTDSFGAVPPSMSYSFTQDSNAPGNAFAGVSRDSGIWTFRHECPAARALCGEQEAVRVRVGDPPDAVLEAVSPRVLAGRPVGIALRLGAEAVGDLQFTVLAQKSGTEESASMAILLPGDQTSLEFNFPSLSVGTWVFGLSTQTEHVNPRAGDAAGAATELVQRGSLAEAQTTVEVVPASSFLVGLSGPGEEETVLAGALLLGREAVLRIAALPPPLEELTVVLSGRSGVAQIEPQTVILSPSTHARSVRVLPSVAGDWLFSIAVNTPPGELAAGQVDATASTVLLTVALPSAVQLLAPRFAAPNRNIPLRLELERGLSTQQATFDIDISIDGASTSTLTVALPGGTTSVESEVLADALGDWVFTVTAARGVSPARAVAFADASATVTVSEPQAMLQASPPSPVLIGRPVDLRLGLSLVLLSEVSLTVRASHDGTAPPRSWIVNLAAQQEGDEAYADVTVFSALTDLEVGLWTFRVDADDALGPPLNELQLEVQPLPLRLELRPDRVNAGDRVSAVLCLAFEPMEGCPAEDVEGTIAYGIDAAFRLRGESDRGGQVFSEVITITAAQTTSTRAVSLGPLPAGIWSFTLADMDEMPLVDSITLAAPPQLVSFAAVTQVQLEVLQPKVAAGEAVRLRLVPDGVYDRAREFVVRGSIHTGDEAVPLLVVPVSADTAAAEVSLPGLLPGLWSLFLTENLVGTNTATIPVLGTAQVRVGFPAITVEGPVPPGVFASDGISYAYPNNPVVLRVSTALPPRQQVTFMLRGESDSGEFTDMQPVVLNPDGSPGTASFSISGEGLWTFGIVQQDPANTADPAVPSALALVRVGPPLLRLSGYDSGGSGQDMQLRLSSPLAVTGDFAVKGVNGSSSLTRMVSFAQETQKDINFGRLTGGQWRFRVIDSSPTGAADLSRAEREVLIEGFMLFTVRFQPEHANAVRYDSARSRYFALADTPLKAQWFTPNGASGVNGGSNCFVTGVRARITQGGLRDRFGIRDFIDIESKIIGLHTPGRFNADGTPQLQVCPGANIMADLDVTLAALEGGEREYRFQTVTRTGNINSFLQRGLGRIVYAEPKPAVESFSPGQNVIAIGDTAELNLQLRRSAVVDSRFTVLAQDISAAGSSPRFNTMLLLRGERSAAVLFRNMERGVWSFTLMRISPPELQMPQLLATAPVRVVAGSIFVRIQAPASVPDAEVAVRLVPSIPLPAAATFTVTAAGMPAGGGPAFAPMMQAVHLPEGESEAAATFSDLSAGDWLFRITAADAGGTELDLSSTAAVTVGSLRVMLHAADLDRRVQAGRDVELLLSLPQPPGSDVALTVGAEGPQAMSRSTSVTLRSGASAVSTVFPNLISGQWRFSVTASEAGIDTRDATVTLDVVPRSALRLGVRGAANLAGVGSTLLSGQAAELLIAATPAAIDNAQLTLQALSGTISRMVTVTLPADTTATAADFGMLPDGVWRFSVAEIMPDDLFTAAQEVMLDIGERVPRGVLSARSSLVRGSSGLFLTVAFDIPVGPSASDNIDNRLIAISPAGDQTSRTDSFGAVPPSMSYSFRDDSSAADNSFPGLNRDSGIWTFRHECFAVRVSCGGETVRVRVGGPPRASLEAVSSRTLAGRPVPVSLRLSAEAVGDLRLTVLAQKSGTEERTNMIILLPGDQTELEFNFPPLSAGTWVFGLSTQTEHVNPRAGDGADTELVRRDSLAVAQTTVEVVLPSSIRLSGPGEEETVLAGALLLGREAVLRIAAMPHPVEELEVVLSGSSTMAQIEPQTVILSPSTPARSARVQPSTAGDWLFSIAVNTPSGELAAGRVDATASTVLLTVAPPSAVQLSAPRFVFLNRSIALRLELERGLSTQQASFDIGISVDGVASTSTLTLALPSGTTSAESEVPADALGEWVFTVTAVRGVSPARAVAFADASVMVAVADKSQAILEALPEQVLITRPVNLLLSLSLPLLSAASLTVSASHDGTALPRSWPVELAAQQEGDEAYTDVTVFSALTDLEAGLWTFEVSPHPALGPPLTSPTVMVRLPQLMLEPTAVVPGERVVLTAAVSSTAHGGFSMQVQVIAPGGSEQQPIPVQVAAGQSSGTAFFVPVRAGDWEFVLIEVVPGGGLGLDVRSDTLTLTVVEAQLDVSMPEGIDADDLVLALRILRLCPPPGECSDSGVTEDSLRLNLRQGAGPMPLSSLRLPEVAGDGTGSGQADIVMLLDYLSGVRGNVLFPPGAPLEFREVRLQVIEELLGR